MLLRHSHIGSDCVLFGHSAKFLIEDMLNAFRRDGNPASDLVVPKFKDLQDIADDGIFLCRATESVVKHFLDAPNCALEPAPHLFMPILFGECDTRLQKRVVHLGKAYVSQYESDSFSRNRNHASDVGNAVLICDTSVKVKALSVGGTTKEFQICLRHVCFCRSPITAVLVLGVRKSKHPNFVDLVVSARKVACHPAWHEQDGLILCVNLILGLNLAVEPSCSRREIGG